MNNTKRSASKVLPLVSKKQDSEAFKILNPKREELTPTILKSFKGYENLTDEEAEDKCESIKTFARLLLEYFSTVKNSISIDNQEVITLEKNRDSKIVSINKNKTKPKAA